MDSDVGIRFKSALGRGGVVEDIYMENIQMVRIKGEAVILTMNYVINQMGQDDLVAPSNDPEDIPTFQKLYFEKCQCIGARIGVKINGLAGYPDSISNIHFHECYIDAKEKNVEQNCKNIVYTECEFV